MTSQTTHPAVVTVALRAPLEVRQVPTIKPEAGEVRVEVHWTASTPLDLHQADGGLLVTHPYVLGDGVAGKVVEVGKDVTTLKVGDTVFGFTWATQKEKAHQQFVTGAANLFGKLPPNVKPEEAVTVPNNFVTAWHTFTTDLNIELPWPKPASYSPPNPDLPILIWGGSSSVGQYAIQILKYYGYKNIITTASKRHHDLLKSYGATHTFDYTTGDVVSSVRAAFGGGPSPRVLDCIGSLEGSMAPLAKIVPPKSKVAVLLPVILKHASETEAPEYGMDTQSVVPWAEGVVSVGVRTHFYLQNKFNAEHLQPEIMPTVLADGIIKPNKVRIVEGPTMLARAQKALDTLRRREVSGERLVWRVTDSTA